ncbi:MAG: PadR family transcriptional regulator [Acidimicrobiales bacterium]
MAARDEREVGLPRHYLRPCLLLLLAEGPSHGYELLEQVRAVGVRSADPGGLYRCLRTMENEELVSSWWEPSQAGPARRTYLLTEVGRAELHATMVSLGEVHRLLGGMEERYELRRARSGSAVSS